MADAPGIAEIQDAPAEAPVEHHAGIAQGAIGHQHRNAADGFVDDLVPQEDAQGIGAGIAIDDDTDHRLHRTQIFIIGCLDIFGISDRRYLIAARPVGDDLRKRDRGFLEIGFWKLGQPGGIGPALGGGQRRNSEGEENSNCEYLFHHAGTMIAGAPADQLTGAQMLVRHGTD